MEKTGKKCMECSEIVAESDTFYSCDSCLRTVHKKCSELTSSEERCMALKRRLLLYICTDCRVQIARMPYIVQMLDEVKRDISELKQLRHVEASTAIHKEFPEKSYYEALTSKSVINSEQTIVIKPKERGDSQLALRTIRQMLNPAELNIGIKKVRSTKSGDILIKCPTKIEGEKLKDAAANQLADNYIVETMTKRLPRLKVVGVDKNNISCDLEEIEQSLRKQNKWIGDDGGLKVTYVKTFGGKNSHATVYLECSANLYHEAMNRKKMYLGWQRCPVYEELSIQRCFACQGYFHKNSNCGNPLACVTCGGPHDVSECPEAEKKCRNCVLANNKYRTKYDTHHAADDNNCPTYQYHISCLRSKIDYGP